MAGSYEETFQTHPTWLRVVSISSLHQDARGLVSHNCAFILGVGGSGLRWTPRSARCAGFVIAMLRAGVAARPYTAL